jgi:hypothetical protein
MIEGGFEGVASLTEPTPKAVAASPSSPSRRRTGSRAVASGVEES